MKLARSLILGAAVAALALAPALAAEHRHAPAKTAAHPQTAAWPKGQYHTLDALPDWGGVPPAAAVALRKAS